MNQFQRLEKLVGDISFLKEKTVLVLGCGGVGGYVVEGLARSGIGTFILVDFDIVEESNINRQIIALSSTIGKLKVDVLKERILDISPDIEVVTISEFIDETNYSLLFHQPIDYFIDCCDTMKTKKLVLKECFLRDIPILISTGTGNRLDPSKLEIMDLRKTQYDPLARVLRKYIKDEKITGAVMCLASTEIPFKTHELTPGSSAFVPSSAGLLIASYVFSQFLMKK